jgi:hypothetical protein
MILLLPQFGQPRIVDCIVHFVLVPIDDVYNDAGPAVVILEVNFEPDLFSVAQVGEETVFKCPYCEFAELDRCMIVA